MPENLKVLKHRYTALKITELRKVSQVHKIIHIMKNGNNNIDILSTGSHIYNGLQAHD